MQLHPDAIELLRDEFMRRVVVTDTCWQWGNNSTRLGYGWFGIGAHRFSYILYKGSIPDGYHLHHICGNKLCVNPDHLQPLSMSEHGRITSLGNRNHVKTHCNRGHLRTDDNIMVVKRKSGQIDRVCKECARIRWRKFNARRASCQ